MIKLAFKFIFFIVGVGVGIYLGVNFPALAGKVSAAETARLNAAIANAKVEVLNEVIKDQQAKTPASGVAGLVGSSGLLGGGGGADPNLAKYQKMLDDNKAIVAANAK